jgi:membrane-bound lytic murein transglycosylase A
MEDARMPRPDRRLVARIAFPLLALGLTISGTGCSKQKIEVEPDYARQLRPGESALRLVTDPMRMPDLTAAYDEQMKYREFLLAALDRSITWFNAPSSKQFFPFNVDGRMVSHDEAKASVIAFQEAVGSATSAVEFDEIIRSRFDVYESVGYNNEGIVLFTGYYAGVFPASRTQSAEYRFPLYTRPADLVTDPVTGEPRGRDAGDGTVVPYYTRREIEESGMFAGSELVWLKDELSAYIIQVNGSARLRMDDGTTMYIGYAGKTDRPYYGLGQSMLDEGILTPNNLSLPAIKQKFRENPQQVIDLIYRNECYVFFTEYEAGNWPAGSLGVQVTEETSLATDKKIYPRGGVTLVDTQAVNLSYVKRPFLHFMMDQDTGGAIKAPGRADIFMGSGEMAEILAGGQYAEGRLFYFFLKPDVYAAMYSTDGAVDEAVALSPE